jgi:ribosome-associated protein
VRQGKNRGDLIKGIFDAPTTTRDGPAAAADDPLLPFVEALAGAADKRKGRAIAAFHTAPLTDVASFVIVACGRSRPQCNAVAAAVVDDAKELFDREPKHVEGGADGGWTCIDFGDVIVNVMMPTSREFYNIDEIWKNAEQVDLSGIVSPEGPDDMLDDEDLFDDDFDDEADFWDAPNAPDAW